MHRRHLARRLLAIVGAVAMALAACSAPTVDTPRSSSSVDMSTTASIVSSSAGPTAVTSTPVSSGPSLTDTVTASTASPDPQPPPASAAPAVVPPAPDQPISVVPASPAVALPVEPSFTGSVNVIDAATAARMATSWHSGCPVALSDLRYLTVTYRGFDGADHQGELVVAASVADDVVSIFGALYRADYPIASLRLVDDFGGSDDNSMAANNSSAFNCRPVTGGGGFSEHSYGTAIDLNPVQNPYLSGSLVLPVQGVEFTDRHSAPGVIEPGDAVVAAFAEHGWTWGGTWNGPVDYQHFSVSGR